jgi:hypothetical protein
MDDQFDNRHNTGFSMNGDAFNHEEDSYKEQNIPTLDAGYISPELDDDEEDWREKMHQDLRQDMGMVKKDTGFGDMGDVEVNELKEMLMASSVQDEDQPGAVEVDPMSAAIKDLKSGNDVKVKNYRVEPNACGCCYGNNGKCFNSVEKTNRSDKVAMDERRKLYEIRKKNNDAAKLAAAEAKIAESSASPPAAVAAAVAPVVVAKKRSKAAPHDLSKEDPKIKAEIASCKLKITEIKHRIDTADQRGLSGYLKNRLTQMYENKQYELTCLTDSLNPAGTKVKKMEKLRAQFFNLEKQKAEIDMKMEAILTKFRSENMSIEERDTRPDVETLIQGQDDDMDRLWALRANRRKIYAAEYNVDAETGVTTHDKTDFKKTGFMRKQLIAHRARGIAEHNANALK